MQVSVESSSGLERRLKVAVEEERIANAVESRLKDMSRTVKLKGFRAGKVPLKVVAKHGAGVDNIDIPAATEKGVVVMNTPGQNSNAVAELTIGLMLALSRNIPRKKAFEMLLLGTTLSAAEAQRVGLVTRVVADDRLEAEAGALIRRFEESSAPIVQLARRAIAGGLDPVTAIQMATINTAGYFGLRHLGAVAPGVTDWLFPADDVQTAMLFTVPFWAPEPLSSRDWI